MKKKKKSKLDYIIGPKDRSDDIYIRNDNKAWATWDHYPIHAIICEGQPDGGPLRKKKIGVDGSRERKSRRRNT